MVAIFSWPQCVDKEIPITMWHSVVIYGSIYMAQITKSEQKYGEYNNTNIVWHHVVIYSNP